MGINPYDDVFHRQRPTCCSSCRAGKACEADCENHDHTQDSASMQSRAQGPLNHTTDGFCGQVGAPYPCRPYCDPRTATNGAEPDVMGAPIPVERMKQCDTYDEAVKRLCWVETTLRSPAQVAAGASMVFTIEAKWWWQIQSILNLGDQANATFDLVDIRYGQSNYNLELHRYEVDAVGTPQNGIDVRRWNIEMFDKFYPMPASGLNDEIDLTFTNVSGAPADVELVVGGPAVLQIG